MRENNKKELREQYKARKVVGGIFKLCNRENGRFLLQSTDDMQSAHNQLQFARVTGSSMLPALQSDWKKYGGNAFEIEELELLEKKQEQTRQEFAADLRVLLEYWDEKLPRDDRYQ